jgi:hypothetical protein
VVDTPQPIEPNQPAAPIPDREPTGFLATTTGRLVLGGVALVVVLVVIAGIAWAFLFSAPSSEPGGAVAATTGQAAVTQTSAASTPTAPADPIVEPEQKPLESTFTFRNVFAPTLKQPTDPAVVASITAVAASTSNGGSSNGGSSSTDDIEVPDDTLFLVSIQTVDGDKTATFIWNDATYTLKEGETLTGTPWKVVEIGDSSVVMLFGDTQVTLTAGQGLSK